MLRVSRMRLARLKQLVESEEPPKPLEEPALVSKKSQMGEKKRQLLELDASLKPLKTLKTSGRLDYRSKLQLDASIRQLEHLKQRVKVQE
jgi:hypothetical protein